MANLSPFMAFWAGYNAAQKANGLPDLLYGDAHRAWQAWQALPQTVGWPIRNPDQTFNDRSITEQFRD